MGFMCSNFAQKQNYNFNHREKTTAFINELGLFFGPCQDTIEAQKF
jgi:hypothetical protein